MFVIVIILFFYLKIYQKKNKNGNIKKIINYFCSERGLLSFINMPDEYMKLSMQAIIDAGSSRKKSKLGDK